jgi:hypothetical protein
MAIKGADALTAQTVLLKIGSARFLLKYGLLADLSWYFESARKIGEKIVILTILFLFLLPIVVAAEAYVFDQTTSPIIEIYQLSTKDRQCAGLYQNSVAWGWRGNFEFCKKAFSLW